MALGGRAGGTAILRRWFRDSSERLVLGDLAKMGELRGGGESEHLIIHRGPVRLRKCLDVLGHLLRDRFVRSIGTELPEHSQENFLKVCHQVFPFSLRVVTNLPLSISGAR